MTSLPGYYLSSPGSIVYLPIKEAHEGNFGEERGDIVIETGGGKRWVYNQYGREMMKIMFRPTGAQLPAFRALHNAVHGQKLAFYYVTSDGVTIYCRKQKDFLYTRIKAPIDRFELVLELTSEPTPAELLA